ncbi:MAG TPA: Gfo/Idh/MocA family oxidoreductase, partial [Armatimonadota bacterium]|nr:Gfo/Idh/MocA family oxidoreductase [Armatimonadota bacterium]
MLKIALLGMAHVHADGYARQVKDDPETEIVTIWDDDPARGKAASEKWGAPHTADLDQVLGDSSIDGVVVNAPTDQHPHVILSAVRARKHVFTEKALTIGVAESDQIVKAVHETGVKFVISLPRRCSSDAQFGKKIIEQGALGDITLMRARIAHNAALDKWFHGGSAWFADAKAAGGGALFDLGCHVVDLMRWYLGEPAAVLSKHTNFSGAYPIDDNSVTVVEFKNKALGILDVAWVQRSGPNMVEVYGTEGHLLMGAPGQGISLNSRKLTYGDDIHGTIQPSNLPPALPSLMRQWVGAILRGDQP